MQKKEQELLLDSIQFLTKSKKKFSYRNIHKYIYIYIYIYI